MNEKNRREQELQLMKGELMIQEEFESLMSEYLSSNHRRKVERITKAFNFAKQAHAGVKRRDGDPYIMHPIAVARIVCGEMGLGSTSICSALLHDVVEDTEYEVKDIANMFNNKIAQLVDGLTKISGDIFADKDSKQAENFRKLLLTMSSDIRVILIKMADRLHNMRTLGAMRTDKQFKIAGETMFIYAPLAHRLGLFAIKTELEDLSFKYEHPEDFRIINEKLINTEESRRRLFDNFARPVRKRLQELDLTYEMKARVKSAYSIWNKMSTKSVPFEDIYDIFAIRIIFRPTGDVDEKNLCWDIYAAITDIYRTRPDRLRDWVSRPKANGYQALHLTVMGPDGQWIEIQIRSKRMDEIDEKGFAAHWKYKENNVEEDTELDKWLQTITEILENPNPNTLDFLDTIKMNLFSSEIFVFTPKGELKTLPKGATALDFAYDLHTDIGDTCIGAKINHHLTPLSHKLESGDQVEILTSKSQHPNIEWLNYVTTAKARTKIESVLRRERKEAANAGKRKVMDALRKATLEPTQSYLDKLTTYFGFSKREDFYYAVEKGDVTIPENVRKLLKEKNGNVILKYVKKAFGVGKKKPLIITPSGTPPEKPVFDKTRPYELREESFRRNYVVASCCKPIPGDDVFGFINDDNSVIVHKRSCPLGIRLKSNFGERILSTAWSSHTSSSFEATLHVTGIDGVGVLTDIARIISGYNVNIIRLIVETKDGVFEGKINMMVHDVEDIQKMCIALSKIKNIQSVSRIAD
ncbi:MAG: RelA/SpoT family protein [Tannerella sp.]|jgi:GTP pyrophosphokinase|nr:RelA/SpoT family protein [Tannerella sp.]